uniref:Uncharacterized protein n=1 Tax=Rhizophora mucronata TaxID=61149 RepID=A0A2P2PD74_RHIMU
MKARHLHFLPIKKQSFCFNWRPNGKEPSFSIQVSNILL